MKNEREYLCIFFGGGDQGGGVGREGRKKAGVGWIGDGGEIDG